MAAPPSRARLLELMKVQCQIFGTTYNPDGVRMGNKVLRQKLKGPALAAYYPRRLVTPEDLSEKFARFNLEIENEKEDDRLEHLAGVKSRGKGAPKKKKGPPDPKGKKK